MAAKTFYFKDAAASSSNHGSLQDGGSAPAAATTATGWTVSKTATGNFSAQDYAAEQLNSTFSTTSSLASSSGPNNTTGDCWRSENTINGTFANANWTIAAQLRAVTSGGDQDGRLRVRIWRSAARSRARRSLKPRGARASGRGASVMPLA